MTAYKINVDGSLSCIKGGRPVSLANENTFGCCDSFGAIYDGDQVYYDPDSTLAYKDTGCVYPEGYMLGEPVKIDLICSFCGDGICDNWENPCTCDDCPKT